MRKCGKKCVRNIAVNNIEIDYDKLVEAIVKAQNSNKENAEQIENGAKAGFWKSVGYIITNSKKSNGYFTSKLFCKVLSGFFNMLAVLSSLASIFGLIGTVIAAFNFNWSQNFIYNNILSIVFFIVVCVVLLLFSLLFRASANELSKEKDRNYIISVFSGLVAFAALIVSLFI